MADAVVEVAADGSFDAGAGDAEALRREGNAAFQRKDFARARSLYSQALAARKDDHLTLGNRSAAALALGDAEAALADATRAVKIAPTWAKGFWRKAAACEALGDVDGARESFERLAELVPKDSADGKRAVNKLAALTKSGKSTQRAVKKGFLASARGIYGRDDNQGSDDSTGWRGMLRRLKEGCNPRGVNNRGENVVLDDGVFGKLLVEREFQRLVYPGIPPEQLLHAPRNLQALLEDPWYEHELVALMPRVQSKAESVLTNVKKRGAAQGEVMDAATERMLIPQVLQEAFGREVLAMVHRVNYKKHVLLANDDRMLADPNADMATWDQLDDTFLDELLGHNSRGFAVLDEFMGEEWTELLLNDVRRMVKRKPLMPAVTSAEVRAGRSETPAGRLRFIELAECTSEFPALAELVEKLHALPFEINRKRPAHARLCAQFAHSTAFHALGTGEFQPLRLDCGVGDKDNGFKITCVYCFNGVSVVDEPEEESSTFVHRAGFDAEAHVERVKPRSDRLIAFQSRSVLNEITPVAAGAEDLYYLTFWIHGQELR